MSSQNTIKLNFLDWKIKGPETIHILKPKNIKDVNQNYIILLGDNHGIPVQPNTQGPDMDKFLFELNKLANIIRCDFYLEDWNVKQNKLFATYKERDKKAFIERVSKYESTLQKYAIADPLTETDIKYIRFHNYKNFSDMQLLKSSNSSCFFKIDPCRYKNLKWHYGDLRQRLDSDNGYDHCNLNYFLDVLNPFIDNLKKKSITTEIINELIENIDDSGKDVLQLFITDIKSIINDRLKFITIILSDEVIQKQFNKMNPTTKMLFSETNMLNFLNLYENYYDKKYDSIDIYETYNHIADLILEYKSASRERKEKIVEYLNSIHLNTEQIGDFYGVIAIGSVFVLDTYFLMRIFKQDPIVNNKIVVGYFGADHCDFTSDFLVNILKTHTLVYQDDASKAVPPRNYITIAKNIFLPGHMLPAHIKKSTKKPRQRSSRNSRVKKLQNRSFRSRLSNTTRSTRKMRFSI